MGFMLYSALSGSKNNDVNMTAKYFFGGEVAISINVKASSFLKMFFKMYSIVQRGLVWERGGIGFGEWPSALCPPSLLSCRAGTLGVYLPSFHNMCLSYVLNIFKGPGCPGL